ncbi:hypothetical protein VW35_16785 [Devosia soli]|uniref:RiboL-PSP-HEPN domain-containing protein n=1 Tax=Devosia soli TaxID=361041 RepID=A0A0F5L2M4_9HYPH|nr:hypothetical protein [Devosia soli]KKB76459.1 hypothetical protein VW35_16785 [Devosia soli]
MHDQKLARAEEFQVFLKHLHTYDMLGVVIVGALYIEQELKKLCKSHMYDAEAIDQAKLTFDQWVHLSIAFGLTAKLKSSLKSFANVRNKYAHQLGYEITEKAMKDLVKSFDGEHRGFMHTSIRKTNVKLGLEAGKDFHDFDLTMRMLMVVTTLRGALVTANSQAVALKTTL